MAAMVDSRSSMDTSMQQQMESIMNGSKYVFKVLQMPNIKGIAGLTKAEIKRDIRDIERLISEESDSDSSIKSGDVLNSNYPVKPRKTLKVPIRMDNSLGEAEGEDSDDQNVGEDLSTEDIVEFMKTIETCRRGVFEAEREKERLEIKYQAIRDSYIANVTKFTTAKKEQENYFRVLQSIFIRLLRVHMYYNKQNRMIFDILNALKFRRHSVGVLQTEVDRLKKLKESKANTIDPRCGEGSFLLRVTLRPSETEVVFFIGQNLSTPMGTGEVTAIHPSSGSLHVRLTFGIMYTNISAVISWGNADISADETMCNNWTALDESLKMPDSTRNGIKQLVDPLYENEDVTDADEHAASDDMENGSIDEIPAHAINAVIDSIPSSQLPSALDSLQLVFAPPAAIPHIVDNIVNVAPKKPPTLRFCKKSIKDGGQKGLSGASAYDGDISQMKAELQRIADEIQSLEDSQAKCIRLVEKSRIESARLLQQSTSIRLSMFTRRVRHRHNMSANNVGTQAVVPLAAAPVPAAAANDAARSMLNLQPTNGIAKRAEVSAEENGLIESEEESTLRKSTRVRDDVDGSKANGHGGKAPSSTSNATNSSSSSSVTGSTSENTNVVKKRSREEKMLDVDAPDTSTAGASAGASANATKESAPAPKAKRKR